MVLLALSRWPGCLRVQTPKGATCCQTRLAASRGARADSADVDGRTLLEALLTDVLLVHALPGWPAALPALLRLVGALAGARGLASPDAAVRQVWVRARHGYWPGMGVRQAYGVATAPEHVLSFNQNDRLDRLKRVHTRMPTGLRCGAGLVLVQVERWSTFIGMLCPLGLGLRLSSLLCPVCQAAVELLGQVAAQGAFEARCAQRDAAVLSQLLAAEGVCLAAPLPSCCAGRLSLQSTSTEARLYSTSLPPVGWWCLLSALLTTHAVEARTK